MLDGIVQFALVANTLIDFVDRRRSVEHEANGLLDVFSLGRPEARAFQSDSIDGFGRCPMTLCNGVRQDVLIRKGAGNEKTVGADTNELRDPDQAA